MLLVSVAWAQRGSIGGLITDAQSGDPLMAANVTITGPRLSSPTGGATDITGRYTVRNLPAGRYTLKVGYIGYADATQEVVLGAGQDLQIDFALEPRAIQFETYVVTASRRRERIEDAPAAISVISEMTIRQESNTNLGDYLKSVKGVDFTQSGVDSYNLSARGFNSSFSSRLLTLTDGRMANIPSLRLIAYNVIPVSFEDVKQFEVVLGPSSALYGPNAHSGVLNIVTKSPRESVGTSFNAQVGSRKIRKFSMRHAAAFGPLSYKVSAVAFSAYDWEHFNDDEYEGHDPIFIGRPSLANDRVDNGGSSGEFGSPTFTEDLLSSLMDGEIPFNGVDDNGNGWIDENPNWVGLRFGDGIDNRTPFPQDAETGSPLITSGMLEGEIAGNGIDDNGNGLIDETSEHIGLAYADGIDNDGDGLIDEGIDSGIDNDDRNEPWYDGIDNDGDGEIDEPDEVGDRWLRRIDNHGSNDFGEYIYDADGNMLFDTNENGIFGDDWASDGLDNDDDGVIDEPGEGDVHLNFGDLPRMVMDANDDGVDDFPKFDVRNLRYDLRLDYDPNDDFSLKLSHGYAKARNINITGIARYLADNWIYRYYQGRLRYKNFFAQTYLNTSVSGTESMPTRNLATGEPIFDRSKKFSAQLQHSMELFNDRLRFVWGVDYFLTLPDTRGSILSDNQMVDNRDNNGSGEAGSPVSYVDLNDNRLYDPGEAYNKWATDDNTQFGAWGDVDTVMAAIADGIDNDGDSDDYEDLNGNGRPDPGEPGVNVFGLIFADGLDNDGDGRIDENIDEGIDESAEDNRYIVNELGVYYQLNWKIFNKFELIQATRFDTHDRLTDLVDFNNQNYKYSPFNWKFDFSKTEGLQVSPKVGLVYKPADHQNLRLTWARAYNTPSNQALFLDIFVTRASIFKVFARGASGGYIFPRGENDQIYYYDTKQFQYTEVDSSEQILFYLSVDPRIDGYFKTEAPDLPEIEAEIVSTWEVGYKGRLRPTLYGTLDVYASHYNSFISPVTFITPIVLNKKVLTSDYDGDGVINSDPNNIVDQEDYEEAFDHWQDHMVGVGALEIIEGYTPPIIVGYLNYGEVDLYGFDMSLSWFMTSGYSIDLNYSFISISDFYNPITGAKDPINAPKHKGGLKLKYNLPRGKYSCSLNFRFVDGFFWSSGVYFGQIKAYSIVDFHGNYQFNSHLSGMLTLNNLFDYRHVEIIGGPSLGRSIILRVQARI